MDPKIGSLAFLVLILNFSYSSNLTIPAGNLKWSFPTGDYIVSSPVINDGTIYIGSADGSLYAMSYYNGEKIWSYKTGGKIESSPFFYDGTVYIGSTDGSLYALDSTNGSLLWKYQTLGKIYSTPLAVEGIVYFGSTDGIVYALNSSKGSLLWKFSTNKSIYSSPAFAYDTIYIGSTDGSLYALNAFIGAKMWSFSTGGPIYSSPAVSNYIVYFGSDDYNLYALNAVYGLKLWNFSTSNKVQSTPFLSGDSVYVSSNDANLYSISISDATEKWNVSSGEQIQSSPVYVDSTRTIYFGSADKNLYAVNEDGKILWKYQADDWVLSKPAYYKGLIYVGSYDRRVYALSTMTTGITPFNTDMVMGNLVTVHGYSMADAGVKRVEVKVNDGPWVGASGNENWSYDWIIEDLKEGAYTIQARTIDNNGEVEIEPYNSINTFVTKNASLVFEKMYVEFPSQVNFAQPIEFFVKDANGKPVPFPKLVMDGVTYYGDDNGTVSKDQNGLPIRIFKEGLVNFTILKDGYVIQSPDKLVIQVVAEPIPSILYLISAGGFVFIFLGIVITYMLIRRRSKKPQKQG